MEDNTGIIDLGDLFNGDGHVFTEEEIKIIRKVLEILKIDPNETNNILMSGKLTELGVLILKIRCVK